MSIRLTESRLRQIIREELASLSESDHDDDPLAGANTLAAGSGYGYSHYIDLEIYDTTGMLMKTPRNIDVTEDLFDLIDPGFGDLSIMAILTKPPSNKMEKAEVRIYGSEMDLEEASMMATNSSEVALVGDVTPISASSESRPPRAMQMRNHRGEPVNAPITSPLRKF